MTSAAWACSPGEVRLKTGTQEVRFSVDVADTSQSRAQGLMFVTKLPSSKGMFFVYDHPQTVSFWMRNTLIPLDMIFADATGRVTQIHANAKPLDETSIRVGPDIQFVLEINGGLAQAMGLGAGSVLQHPAISQDNAAWPCK